MTATQPNPGSPSPLGAAPPNRAEAPSTPRPRRTVSSNSAVLLTGLMIGLLASLLGCAQTPTESRTDSPTASPKTRSDLKGAASGWNVVLISVDTLRADRLNSFGYERRPTSPNIDRLANSGIRFLQATAPRAATWPSLATVLTGLYPSGHGVYQNQMTFSSDTPTLPKILQDAGYVSGAFLSNMCNAGHDGWDERDCSRNASDEDLLRNAEAWLSSVTRASEGNEAGGAAQTSSQPVLLWTHFFGAHGPYYNGGDLAAELDPGYEGRLAPKRGVLNRVMTEGQSLSNADVNHLNALYDAAIIGTDRRIGRLLSLINQHLGERTVIIFLADHGEELYQHHKYLYHACSVYETTLRVPLAIQAPGLIGDGSVSQPVELSDVLPTLLDLLGVDREGTCSHGESLLGYLAQPNRGGVGKLAISEYGLAPIGTVRRGAWKLIENPTNYREVCLPNTGPDFYPIGQTELYNLAEDPGEQSNLAELEPAKVSELSEARKARVEGLCKTGVPLNPANLTDEQIREMEAMGYVVGGG